MKRLRDKISPESWQIFGQITGLLLVPIVVIADYFDCVPIAIVGIVLELVLIVGHFIFWRCPWCGRLLPTEPFWRHLSTCPYCSEHL